jgi:5-bromo-4-chloroindolyl phosphate hydrolysis protein
MDLLTDSQELKILVERASKWDSTIAIEVPRLVETIEYFIEERKSFQLLIEKARETEQENEIIQKRLQQATDKLREIAKLVAEYGEDNEITSLSAHRKIDEAIKKFINEIDQKHD